MSVGIPKSLTSYGELLKGAESLKQITVENVRLLPNNQNSSQVYSPKDTNSIYFRIPNFSNSFLSTKESFLQFDVSKTQDGAALTSETTNFKLTDWMGIFNRIVIKSSNGLVLQDTNNAHLLSKMFYLVSTHSSAKMSEGDYSETIKQVTNAKGVVSVLQNTKQTYTMKFNHGILNLDQALPLHLMGSSFALDIELYLSSPEQCIETIGNTGATNNKSYQLTNVSYNMKLLKLDESLIRKYNTLMSSNNEIVLPFNVYRNYVSSQSSISQNHFFHESCTDIQKMFTVITDQSDTFKLNTATPIPFFGCVKNVAEYRITEYSVKVSNHHIYNEPVKEAYTNAVSLKYLKNCVNGKDTDIMKLEKIDAYTTGISSVYENGNNFIIGSSFIYSNEDNISQGISLNGNPIQLSLTFGAVPNVRVQTFMELRYNMHISKGEVTFHEVDTNRQSY